MSVTGFGLATVADGTPVPTSTPDPGSTATTSNSNSSNSTNSTADPSSGGTGGGGTGWSIAAPTAGQDNLLANGSFEYPDSSRSPVDFGYTFGQAFDADPRAFRGYGIPGWRISEGTIDVKHIYWKHAPGQGNQSIDLVGSPDPATIHQTFFTQRGKRYTFSGYVSHNPGIPDSRAGVYLNGLTLGMLRHQLSNSTSDMRWTAFSVTFTARDAQTTLTIRDLSGYNSVQGTALDALKVPLAPNCRRSRSRCSRSIISVAIRTTHFSPRAFRMKS